MTMRSEKQVIAWKRNWGLMLMASFRGQLDNYSKQTGEELKDLRDAINDAQLILRYKNWK